MSEEPNGNGFYRGEYFSELSKRFDRIEVKLNEQNLEIAKINNKLAWMLGWAAGAGAIATLIIEYIKTKLINH